MITRLLRWILLFVGTGALLAACGNQPELVLPTQITLPEATPAAPDTAAEAVTSAPAPATLPPLTPTPTIIVAPLPAERDVVENTEDLQILAISGSGAVNPPATFKPGDLYIFTDRGQPALITADLPVENDPAWGTNGNRIYFTSDIDGTTYIYTVNADNENPVQRLAILDQEEQRQPAVSPDGLNVAFTTSRQGNDDVFKMSADGRFWEPLTTNEAADYDPDWSPEGNWITFVSERDGNPEIYIMDVLGEQVTRLTDHPGNDTQPVFSPDARTIAFVSDRNNGVPQVFSVELTERVPDVIDTSYFVAIDLTAGPPPPLDLDTQAPIPFARPLTNSAAPKSGPAWYVTEEGASRLIFASQGTNFNAEQSQIFTMSADGSTLDQFGDFFLSYSNPVPRPGP